MSEERHCWWFSQDSGRCTHLTNSQSPFKSWCCAERKGIEFMQHASKDIVNVGCEFYKKIGGRDNE